MCGINGFISSRSILDSEKLIRSMNERIFHRGPDSGGSHVTNENGLTIAIGMRRLSIIDLEGGSQPIYNSTEDLVLVFNGEIYNYLELRKLCQARGYAFKTNTDSEVILALYELDGPTSFKKLDGMYAFSILDLNKRVVVLARDYFGEKPLFIRRVNDGIYWSSEIKSLLLTNNKSEFRLNTEAIIDYFSFQYVPGKETVYSDITKVERNSTIIINIDTKEETMFSTDEEDSTETLTYSKSELKLKVRDLVQEVVKSRTPSDVGIGAFLSGGVDSGVVVASLAQRSKIDAFTVRIDDKRFDESKNALQLASHLDVKTNFIEIPREVKFHDVISAILVHDQPFADPSLFPSFLLFKECKKTDYRVFLSGDGGDEIFYGYAKYNQIKISSVYCKIVPRFLHKKFRDLLEIVPIKSNRGPLQRIKKIVNSIDYEGFGYSRIVQLGLQPRELSDLFIEDIEINSHRNLKKVTNIKQAVELDLNMSLEGGLLPKVDRASMSHSIEVRAPFLSKRLYSFVRSLDETKVIGFWAKKQLLKSAFEELFPKGYFHKKKRGFDYPIASILVLQEVNEFLQDVSTRDFLIRQGLFKHPYVQSQIQKFYSKGTGANFLWTYFCFQVWYRNNISDSVE